MPTLKELHESPRGFDAAVKLDLLDRTIEAAVGRARELKVLRRIRRDLLAGNLRAVPSRFRAA